MLSAMTKRAGTTGADPTTAPIMPFFLFGQTFLKHFPQLIQIHLLQSLQLFFIQCSGQFWILQPSEEMFDVLFRQGSVFEIGRKALVIQVEMGLVFDAEGPAEVVEAEQGLVGHPLLQCLQQCHPLCE